MTAQRTSIRATYDSRETGPRYHLTTMVGGRVIDFREEERKSDGSGVLEWCACGNDWPCDEGKHAYAVARAISGSQP